MEMDYPATAKKILEAVGGRKNVVSLADCKTHLCFVLKDESKADDNAVTEIEGIESVIKEDGQYQVVIGNGVSEVADELNKLGKFSKDAADDKDAAASEETKTNPVLKLFQFISGCMIPLLPAMIGCGLLRVIVVLLTTFAGLSADSSTYVILNGMGDCFFYFMPIFLGYIIAKNMGGTPALFMAVAAALVYPDLVTLMAGSSLELGTFLGMDCTYLFGIPVICTTYTSTVLPMFLMAPVMKYVEKFADWVSPEVLKAFLKPVIFLVICIPVALFVLGPIGGVIGNVLSNVFMFCYNRIPWLSMAVLSAIYPFMVMTGMHYALLPLCVNNLALVGYDALVLVSMFCSNLAQGASSFGVAFKTKNTDIRSEGIAAGASAWLAGVTEPALYGINLRFTTPLICAMIAGGVSGLFCGLTDVVAYVFGGSPSWFSLLTFIGGDNPMRGVIFGLIGGLISVVISFVLSFILYKDRAEGPEKSAKAAGK